MYKRDTGFDQKVARAVYVVSFGASRGATRLRSSVAPRLRIDFLGKARETPICSGY